MQHQAPFYPFRILYKRPANQNPKKSPLAASQHHFVQGGGGLLSMPLFLALQWHYLQKWYFDILYDKLQVAIFCFIYILPVNSKNFKFNVSYTFFTLCPYDCAIVAA